MAAIALHGSNVECPCPVYRFTLVVSTVSRHSFWHTAPGKSQPPNPHPHILSPPHVSQMHTPGLVSHTCFGSSSFGFSILRMSRFIRDTTHTHSWFAFEFGKYWGKVFLTGNLVRDRVELQRLLVAARKSPGNPPSREKKLLGCRFVFWPPWP